MTYITLTKCHKLANYSEVLLEELLLVGLKSLSCSLSRSLRSDLSTNPDLILNILESEIVFPEFLRKKDQRLSIKVNYWLFRNCFSFDWLRCSRITCFWSKRTLQGPHHILRSKQDKWSKRNHAHESSSPEWCFDWSSQYPGLGNSFIM